MTTVLELTTPAAQSLLAFTLFVLDHPDKWGAIEARLDAIIDEMIDDMSAEPPAELRGDTPAA